MKTNAAPRLLLPGLASPFLFPTLSSRRSFQQPCFSPAICCFRLLKQLRGPGLVQPEMEKRCLHVRPLPPMIRYPSEANLSDFSVKS